MIEITEAAKKKIVDLLQEEKNPSLMLRVFVQGGGCSGFQYGFTFDDKQEEDDLNFGFDQVKVLVDSMSVTYLSGSSIDFKETDMGSSFTINNPNAETTCGCGSSFSI